MTIKLAYDIAGSEGRRYNLQIVFAAQRLSFSCSCEAGMRKRLCKHVKGILSKGGESVISGEDNRLGEVINEFKATPAYRAYQRLTELEELKQRTEDEIKRVKREVERFIFTEI